MYDVFVLFVVPSCDITRVCLSFKTLRVDPWETKQTGWTETVKALTHYRNEAIENKTGMCSTYLFVQSYISRSEDYNF